MASSPDRGSGGNIYTKYALTDALGTFVSGAGDRPRIARFVERMKKRPAYQRAVSRGGKSTPLG
jgi:anti-sigma factor RsiW